MTTPDDLMDAFSRWKQANRSARDARASFHRAIAKAVRGGMSQSQVASLLGWPRQRVSKVLSERS